ncbi:MAG: tRNA lysidine(34) synthetase TilS, partial [Bdellovibrionaceae bacterium]|nr:tRNA lysidine(34) synthetase TilS [Pseudobdellovibrionaceae bacterium]
RRRLVVAHFHHGKSTNQEFRDRAQYFVRQVAQGLGLTFVSVCAQDDLTSEAAMREARYLFLRETLRNQKADFIVTGHHAQDLLETRLLRLIRGTGPEGLVAMRTLSDQIYRPFLRTPPEDLKAYLLERGFEFLSDPQNHDPDFLRVFLREKWLPSLEERQPGALGTLARSLQVILDDLQKTSDYYEGKSIDRGLWISWSQAQRKSTIARLLRDLGCRDFSSGQIEEILRRLDNRQNEFSFSLAGVRWLADARQIWAERQG